MFRKSKESQSLDLFESYTQLYKNSNLSQRLTDPKGWHNIFYKDVFCRIDETLFAPLYSSSNGAPNAPLVQLTSMIILKELLNISDSRLFEQLRFNSLYRMAIGINSLNEAIPVESTYYLFRKRVSDYDRDHTGPSLFEQVFDKVTKGQIKDYHVDGSRVRMDSKLIGTQISWDSRYVLIHKTLNHFWKGLSEELRGYSDESDREYMKELFGEKPEAINYRETSAALHDRLERVGALISRLLKVYADHSAEHYDILQRLFEEQYECTEQTKILLRPKEQVSADSLQSTHDTDATYRNKGGTASKGVVVNATETCTEKGPNLITSMQCEANTTADNSFLREAVEKSEEVLDQRVETVVTDGAYHSVENDVFEKDREDLNLVHTGFQGPPPRFILEESDGKLTATDSQSGIVYECSEVKKTKRSTGKKRWSCKADGKRHYFDEDAVASARKRQQLASFSKEELKVRNNVESTMFMLGLLQPLAQ